MIDKIKVGTAAYSIVPVLSPLVDGGSVENPLRITTDALDENNNYIPGLTIAIGSGLRTDQKGLFVYAQSPLVVDDYGLRLRLDAPLETSSNVLTLRIGSGLTIDGGTQLDIRLKDPAGPLAINYGLELVIGSDVYTDGGISTYRSLSADVYGLHLRLSTYTATHNSVNAIQGNALYPTDYGLSLMLGTSLTVDDDALYVKLSEHTIRASETGGTGLLAGNALAVVSSEGAADGLTLRLQARNIGGIYKPLLTVKSHGLDIDIDALKTVLGLS